MLAISMLLDKIGVANLDSVFSLSIGFDRLQISSFKLFLQIAIDSIKYTSALSRPFSPLPIPAM